MLQTPFPIVPFSISLDTVLSYNYRVAPVIKVVFWFQSWSVDKFKISTQANSWVDHKGKGWPVTASIGQCDEGIGIGLTVSQSINQFIRDTQNAFL